jgi:hypothetical protein
MPLEVERQIKAPGAQPGQKWNKRPRRTPPIVDDYFVQPGMPFQNRLRFGLDRPCDMRLRPRPPDSAEQRQCADYIANRAEQNDEDTPRSIASGRSAWSDGCFNRQVVAQIVRLAATHAALVSSVAAGHRLHDRHGLDGRRFVRSVPFQSAALPGVDEANRENNNKDQRFNKPKDAKMA